MSILIYFYLYLEKFTSSITSRKGCTNALYNNQNRKNFSLLYSVTALKSLRKNRSIENFGRNFTFLC